jgi:hypothetical protein
MASEKKEDRFHSLHDITVHKVVSIFSHGKALDALMSRETPVLVILVGSPGVGKTTVGSTFLKHHPFTSHLKKDDFYTVSSDLLLQRVQPYRNATARLYDEIYDKRKEKHETVTNQNFSILANASLSTIMTKKNDFLLPHTEQQLRIKLLKPLNAEEKKEKEEKENKDASRVCTCGCGKTLKPATIKTHMKKVQQTQPVEQVTQVTQEEKEEKELDRSIVDHTKHGLEIGIRHGLNIIYDTTLKERDIIKEDILPLITQYNKKYNILVLLVTASPEDIKKRLRGRHHEMIGENYVRAIKLELVDKFVNLNKKAFDKAQKYYTDHAAEFKDIVFSFEEQENPQRNQRSARSRIRSNSKNNRSTRNRSTRNRSTRNHSKKQSM